jgi:ABC-type transport system involved in multi-copper enzyme maturation permease subunit
MNLMRMSAVAGNGFREVIRERILYAIGLYALVMLAASRHLPEVSAGAHSKIIMDMGTTLAAVLGVAVTILIGSGLVNKEIDKRTIYVLLAKPVSTSEYIVGKHLGLCAAIGLLSLGMTIANYIVLIVAKVPYSFAAIGFSHVFLFLELCIIASAALMFGVFTSSLLAALMSFVLYCMGHLSESMVKLSKVTRSSDFDRLADAIFLAVPDLSRYNLKNVATYGTIPSGSDIILNIGVAGLWVGIFLLVATIVFSRKQF